MQLFLLTEKRFLIILFFLFIETHCFLDKISETSKNIAYSNGHRNVLRRNITASRKKLIPKKNFFVQSTMHWN